MDGSLGILFNYEGQWVIATRGSFASDQSLKGFFMLQKYDFKKLHKDYTYLFEIIYDDNRIVVKYDYEDLVLLGMINTETGYEVDLYGEGNDVRFKNMVNTLGFKVVKKYDGIRDYTELKGKVEQNAEGFVVRFTNGDRMKVKGVEYLRLHKLMTNVSTTSVWEMLSEDKDVLEILKDVPDEFYKKIKMYVQELRYNHYQFGERAGKIYQYFRYGKYGDRETEPSKKDFALHLQECDTHPKIMALCFMMWDGKSTDKVIWNYLKPEYKKL
jgi:RNA ligase